MDKLFPLLKKEAMTQNELGLNYPQTKGFLEAKVIRVTDTVHNGGRGRPSNLYSLTAKGRRQVEKFKAEGHTGARKRSSTAKAPVKRGRPKVTASKTTAKATKTVAKARKSTAKAKPKVKVRARS